MSTTSQGQLLPTRGWASYIKNRLVQTLDFSNPNPDRWVVLDVESSGLNPKRDRLISIAATAIAFD
ncbi:MAG: hypothetical protein ACLGGW_08595, partial [Gammaproteobacteria bacterium]